MITNMTDSLHERTSGKAGVAIFGRGAMSDLMTSYIGESQSAAIVAYIESGNVNRATFHNGRPLISLPEVSDHLPRDSMFYVAVGYSGLNTVREKFYLELKEMGYAPFSFLHPRASISTAANVGDHAWIMENAAIQCMCEIGDNSVIHMGANIAHHSKIGRNCFVAQGANVCGYVSVGGNCFIGAGAIIHNNLRIGNNCVIGAGVVVKQDMPDDSFLAHSDGDLKGNATEHFGKWLETVRSRL